MTRSKLVTKLTRIKLVTKLKLEILETTKPVTRIKTKLGIYQIQARTVDLVTRLTPPKLLLTKTFIAEVYT